MGTHLVCLHAEGHAFVTSALDRNALNRFEIPIRALLNATGLCAIQLINIYRDQLSFITILPES